MRIEYLDVYDPDIDQDPELTKKENEPYLKKLKSIFQMLSKKEPLYSEIKESVENQKVIEKIGNNQAILYDCQVKAYKYYNHDGKMIKEKYIILSKEKIKIIERSDFGFSKKSWLAGLGAGIASMGCYVGAVAFPPAAPALILFGDALLASEIGACTVSGVKIFIDKSTNNIYDNTKTLDEFEN